MPLKAHPEFRLGALVHTDGAVMNAPSIGGARCFGIFIDEASRHDRPFHINTKGKTAELVKLQVYWLE